MNGVAYFLGALAGGCLIDRYATRAARQRVMGSGWVLMSISYACFGPLAAALPASDEAQLAFIALGMFGQVSDLDGPLNSPDCHVVCLSSLMMVGVIGQGVGAGAIIVPSLPDAQDGLSTELDKAAVVAVWNSCLAGGGAVGPVLAAALTERYGFDLMAAVFAGWCVLALLALGASGWRGGKASASAGVSICINEAIEPPITPINEAVDRRANATGS